MQAQIIAVGSELLTPARLDTNSLFLTERLGRRGVDVVRKVVVGDDEARIAREVRRAREEARLVIVTGGLGPTLDDLSRDGVAEALGKPLIEHPEILEWIAERFARHGRKMTDNNRRQALILEGAEILANPNGTAPGQYYRDEAGIVILLPGPPRELRPMFLNECEPRLDLLPSPLRYYTASLRIAGMGESDVDQRIGPIYSAEPRAVTTILAAPGEIQLHVRGQAATEEEARAIADAVAEKVAAELGDRVYTRVNEPIEQVIGDLLRSRGLQLGLAESCTGGLLAEKITEIPGSSDYFAGGFVSYSERAKIEWLGVSAATIAEYGAVSEECAREMAERARDHAGGAGKAVGVSVTGFAGPEGGTEAAPVGTIFIGLADGGETVVRKLSLGKERDRNRELSARSALDLLRRRLLGL
ncbi:MAG: competence/damage-inducible protein A [Acidobacteria bacterium]|nr:competence/damage-inducible protein A [Acidobacteriota bacterium]